MPQARRQSGALSASEREQLVEEVRRTVLMDVQNSLHSGNDLDAIRDSIDEQLEAYEPVEIDVAAIRNMSEQEINAHWAQVSAVMAASGQPTPEATPPASGGPGSTGRGMLNEHRGLETLSWDKLREMSVEEHRRRRPEIDAWIASQA